MPLPTTRTRPQAAGTVGGDQGVSLSVRATIRSADDIRLLLHVRLRQAFGRALAEFVLGAIERVHRIDKRDSGVLAQSARQWP